MTLLQARDCVPCPATPPQCSSCNSNQQCVQSIQTCAECATVTCIDTQTSSSGGGVSKGALAGAVIGILIFLSAVLALVWYFQRRSKARKAMEAKALEPKPDLPVPAATVLSRPDPVEKSTTPSTQSNIRVFAGQSETTINLDPVSSQSEISRGSPSPSIGHGGHNPFADQTSVRTSSDQSQTNVIPIALLPYGSVQNPAASALDLSRPAGASSPIPSRPMRSPDLNLHFDSRRTAARSPTYDLAHVNVSNDSVPNATRPQGAASMRSEITTDSRASYLSTGTYATDLFSEPPTIVTQHAKILGLSKAQVVEVPSSVGGGGSPLPSSHLTPTSSRMSRVTVARSPLANSSFTPVDIIEMDEQSDLSPFADANARRNIPASVDSGSIRSEGTFRSGAGHWLDADGDSIASGIEASISSATRVMVGQPVRAVSASSRGALSQFSSQPSRYSYAISEASSRADSILESFPFVSPSPTGQQSYHPSRVATPGSAISQGPPSIQDPTITGPDRRVLGLSTFSQASNTSSGLEAFPFELQIDSAADSRVLLPQREGRASLDTLALSRDLTAFPLAYDEVPEGASSLDPSEKSSTRQVHTS